MSKRTEITKLGRLNLSRRGLDQDSRSRRQKSISLDVMDNLDGFQKLVSTIEKSRSRSRFLDLVSMRSANTVFFSPDQDFCDFCVLLEYFLILIENIEKRSRFFSTKSRFLTNISICLDWSRFVLTISIFLDDLDFSRRSR
jgi:hypothetical protein